MLGIIGFPSYVGESTALGGRPKSYPASDLSGHNTAQT